MYSGKICYRGEVKEKTGGVYSCDKMQLVFRLRHETAQGLLDALAAVQSAREKFEALSAPEKKEAPQPELPEEPAEAEAAEETAEETVDNA